MKQKVAVLFGGRSAEHEISIITGIQVINNLDKDKYEAIPVYISKEGVWYSGSPELAKVETYRNLANVARVAKNAYLPPDTSFRGIRENPHTAKGLFKKVFSEEIDVIFPCFHGTYGEDGTAQGLFDFANIPYVGCGLLASAITMDKVITKAVLQSFGLPQVKGESFLRDEWKQNKTEILKRIEKNLKYPVFVKPSSGGSSIGVGKATNKKSLEEAIEVALFYDRRILVEEGVNDPKEVNISVIGYKELLLSEVEMPVATGTLLSYDDKYKNNGGKSAGMASLKRIIPAPIKLETKKKIEEYAQSTFRALDCSGIIRIDFLLSQDEKKIYVNEVNPLPGSVAFYLWEPKGVKFKELLTNLVEYAFERYEDRSKTVNTFSTNVLEGFSGAKGKS